MSAFPHITFAARSDIGRKRTNNEDAFGAFPSSGIFCVADGMGGGDDGEVASAATIKAVERFTKECPISENFTYPIEGIVSGVRNAVNSASSWIAKRTQQKGLKGCGATFVGICFDAAKPNTAIALHAGDSRLYRIRGRSIEQMTVDHSAAELIGAKNDKEVNPMFRGMILRAVGIQPSVELERTKVQLKAHDRILICSDGLSRMVSDRKLLSIIRAGEDLETTAGRLIAAANDAGGVDNITVELIEVGVFPMPLPTSPLVSAASVDPVLETESELTGDTNTQKTKGNDVSSDTTTEDDFIPSTALDGDVEIAEEDLNIPESDTEDDSPDDDPTTRAGAAPVLLHRSPFLIKNHAIVCRLIAKRFVIVGMILALALACYVAACVYSRAADEAREKSAVEAKTHTKEQKDSLQTVEARRKAEQEQKAREAEEERTRAEIKTPAKQRELDEKARKAAERREREEKAAREKAEADALREKEAKAKELARQEELCKAEERRQKKEREEEKKLKEAEEARERARKEAEERARKEKERLEAEEKERQRKEAECRELEARKAEGARALAEKQERERKEREVKEKQGQAISAFMALVEDGTAAKFHAKIKQLIPDEIPQNLYQGLARSANADLQNAEKIKVIASLTRDVQKVTRSLMEYSSLTVENIRSDLADPEVRESAKGFLAKVEEGIAAFDREAGEFVNMDASSPRAQLKCARIIRSVPKWFDF